MKNFKCLTFHFLKFWFFCIYSVTSDVIQQKEQNQPFSISTSMYVTNSCYMILIPYVLQGNILIIHGFPLHLCEQKFTPVEFSVLSVLSYDSLLHRENKMIYRGKEADRRLLVECQVVTCYVIIMLTTTLSSKSHAQFEQMWKDWWDL